VKRVYLSPPHVFGREKRYVADVFRQNWIAPIGPHVDAFEKAFAARVGLPHAVALSSGTAALHLALRVLGLRRGDEVFCSSLTFAASANPIVYEGGQPVFVDCDRETWNMDPGLLEEELRRCAKRGKVPRAVIAVDLYGQCADLGAIRALCRKFGTVMIEDAAEALGATYRGKSAGSYGWANIFSFNGNKIITTSGGGMLATADRALADKARWLSQQARDPAPHYQHSEIGFNYRLSNVLAGIGIAQLETLDKRVAIRRGHFDYYSKALGGAAGISFMPEASYGKGTRWLTCILVDPVQFGADREMIRRRLEAANIESRPVWKPMHLQPVFRGCRAVGGSVSREIFEKGLCLPSGSSLSARDRSRVVREILALARPGARRVKPL
jgi:pyridoxal phosphate-dependent aminotransferase EpsN